MPDTLLRVEGVNFGATILDTDDLSTIRGASLAYLRAPGLVFDALRRHYAAVEALWTGASVGVALIRGAEDQDAVRRRVRELLYDPADELAELREVLPHLTFCVAAVPASTNYLADADTLIAAIRVQQLGQPTVDIPLPGSLQRPCRIDGVRPAIAEEWTGAGRRPMSASVAARRRYGRRMRQDLYRVEVRPQLFDQLPGRFADSFPELVQDCPDELPPSLRQKMALLYLDGNKFGRTRRGFATRSQEADIEFSEHVKARRRVLMQDLIGHLVDLPDMTLSTKNQHGRPVDKFRFETLLWGGDEALFVLPGWRGIEALDVVMQSLDDPGWVLGDLQLTHSVGLLICDAKVPIRASEALVKRLCEDAKATLPADLSQQRTVAQFLILESFEPPDLLADFRRPLYGIDGPQEFTFDRAGFTKLLSAVRELKSEDGLAPSQLYRLLRQARNDRLVGMSADAENVAAFELEMRKIGDRYGAELKDRLGDLGAKGSHPVLRLARLAELRDYVDPLSPATLVGTP
jgi:hypothetical protein